MSIKPLKTPHLECVKSFKELVQYKYTIYTIFNNAVWTYNIGYIPCVVFIVISYINLVNLMYIFRSVPSL